MERVKNFFAWVGAGLLAALGFVLAVVLFRRKAENSTDHRQLNDAVKAIDTKAAAAHAQVDAEADSKQDEVEVQHADAVKTMEADNAKRAAALRDSRAALAKALQRHARKSDDKSS